MESLFGTLKSNWVRHRADFTRDDARADLFYRIEIFRNPCRLHSSLGHLGLESYEPLFHHHRGSDLA